MSMKRTVAVVLTVCLLLSLVGPGTALALNHGPNSSNLPFQQVDKDLLGIDLKKNNITDELKIAGVKDDELVKIIIVMESKSVVEQNGDAVLNDATQIQMEKLEQEQAKVIDKIEAGALKGESLDVSYSYTWLLNGVAAEVPSGAIGAIEKTSGVKQVLLQPQYNVCKTSDTHTSTDGEMIGREPVWANGYTGEGITIAVIDTGLDYDHQNFAPLPEDKLTADSSTVETVAAVLDQLNASQRYPGLTAQDVYFNTKVAYGFNYCDDNLNISHDYDQMGDHGTHVAGIAAANKVEGSSVVGVAPDAQLYTMKVFGANGGAFSEDILAALEDALILGADVVNMSLGTTAGFTSSTDEINAIYNRVALTKTILSVSAGNSYTAGLGNTWGMDLNLTSQPDNSVISEPAIFSNALSIASVENVMIHRNYIAAADRKLPFVETSSSYGLPSILTLTESYQVVVIPGYGAAADFEGLDLTGKIALVQRGVESFVTKIENSQAAGALGCIIYNNSNEEFGMDLTGTAATIPAICITLEDGEWLVSALAQDPDMTLAFPMELAPLPNPYAYQMSDFSSWGVTPDLLLEPDITAPGGNIYSTVNNGEYAVLSGTSMAAPNLSGITALVMQYVRANYDIEDGQFRTLVQNLLMSTSVPVIYDAESGLCYSPRQQGSGLANAHNAVSTLVYLTVDGCDTPKVSMGDDPNRTGIYAYTFNVTNFGTEDVYYALRTSVQTEDVLDQDGLYFMAGTPLELDGITHHSSANLVLTHDLNGDGLVNAYDAYRIGQSGDHSFRSDLDGNEQTDSGDVQACLDALVGLESAADLDAQSLKVAGGETAQVTVDVTLSAEDHNYFTTYYPNGGYVEGFTFLDAQGGGVDLSLPYMGFYGSWDEPDMLDSGFYWDTLFAEEGEILYSQYAHVLWTNFYGESAAFYPGINAYIDEPFDMKNMSVSPNDDGYVDAIDEIYVSLLRNAGELTFRYLNAETGEIYYEQTAHNVSKSCYNMSYGEILPAIYSWQFEEIIPYDFKDANGGDLPNNTKLLLQVEAKGDYEGATADMFEVPITVDIEAPELLNVTKTEDPETGKVTLELTFRENLSVAAVTLMNYSGSEVYYQEGVADVAFDENGYQTHTLSYDITGIEGKLLVALSDYAMNETYYAMNTGGEGTPYGSLVAYQYDIDAAINGWVSFDSSVNKDEVWITTDTSNIVCAEYVGGFVFAQNETGALYGFAYEDMLKDTFDFETTYIAQLDNVYQDLAYDYTTGTLFGLLTYEDDWGANTEIYAINIWGQHKDLYGDTVEAYAETWYASRGALYSLTMTVDDQGYIYVLGTEKEGGNAQLWRFGEEVVSGMTVQRFSMVGDTGMPIDFLQSMTWDHNTGTLYWARFCPVDLITLDRQLLTIDPETAQATVVGTLTGETCALMAPLTAETIASNEIYSNIPLMDTDRVARPVLRNEVLNLNLNGQLQLGYDLDPWYSAHKEVLWSSSDESVISVDENGIVTALSDGSAIVTITAKDDPTLSDSCIVNVTSLTLNIEGIVSTMGAGVGAVGGAHIYRYEMVDGISSFIDGSPITTPPALSFGLDLACSTYGRGSIWACEYGNTGMIYEIDPETGVVKDAIMPMDGEMLFGMSYSEGQDTFSAIMNMYLFVDLELTDEENQKVLDSYDPENNIFMYHRIDMLPYLIESNTGFVTGEDGQGAMSEIVLSGITTMPGGYVYTDTYKDYMGNWVYSGSVNYTASQTLVILDNVGRLWYIDEVVGMTKTADAFGGVTYTDEAGNTIYTEDGLRNGMFEVEIVDENGNVTYNVFHIRCIEETPLTDMFMDGTMPRITYHFSDIAFGGYTEAGAPIFAMSLYDYWNGGITNELYLYIPEVTAFDETLYEDVVVAEERLYALGNTGEFNIVASIHRFEVLGGLPTEG